MGQALGCQGRHQSRPLPSRAHVLGALAAGLVTGLSMPEGAQCRDTRGKGSGRRSPGAGGSGPASVTGSQPWLELGTSSARPSPATWPTPGLTRLSALTLRFSVPCCSINLGGFARGHEMAVRGQKCWRQCLLADSLFWWWWPQQCLLDYNPNLLEPIELHMACMLIAKRS